MKPTASWYAVYTKPKWEKKVAHLLTRNGVINYCPLNMVPKQWHDRKKWVEEPLFTSYVFVFINPLEYADVRKTSGVINFVYWLGKPANIPEEEITAIRTFLGEHSGVQLEKVRIQVEGRVQDTQGSLLYREGVVTELRNRMVKVVLASLGYAMVAQVEKEHIEILNQGERGQKIRRA